MPIDPYYENDTFAEWPQEAQRFKSNGELVSRQRDRLRLALDGGKSIELVDCPYGDDGYHFLYERYDQAGRFYVVRKSSHDDFSYVLVMMPTGRLFTVYGAPVWTSEKSRFLTIGCSLQPPRGTLVIQAPAGEALATEAEFDAALRQRKLLGALGPPVVDLGHLRAARRRRQEGQGVRADAPTNGPWNRFGR